MDAILEALEKQSKELETIKQRLPALVQLNGNGFPF